MGMEWQDKRVLVTGGGGFLGRYIVERLLELNCKKIRSLGRSPQPELEALGVDVICGDIADQQIVSTAAEGCDIVFHTAAKAGIWGTYKEFYSANITGTGNVITACRENGVSILINTSTPSVICVPHDIVNGTEELPYPDNFPAYYPATKAEAEKMVSEASSPELKTVSLRPHLLWGVRDSHILPKLAKRAEQKRLMRIGNCKNIVDMTHVRNAAEAHINAAEAVTANFAVSGKSYFISDDDPVNLWGWIETFLNDIGMPEIKRGISFKKAYFIGSLMEPFFRIFKIKSEPPMTRFVAIQMAFSHSFDISAAKEALNYRPVVNKAEAYKEAVKWIKNERI
jgi:nucleoside-diphosphate-sugar epimerase